MRSAVVKRIPLGSLFSSRSLFAPRRKHSSHLKDQKWLFRYHPLAHYSRQFMAVSALEFLFFMEIIILASNSMTAFSEIPLMVSIIAIAALVELKLLQLRILFIDGFKYFSRHSCRKSMALD